LVQNGDDSGATEVHFIYDDNDYGTNSLYSQELAHFQVIGNVSRLNEKPKTLKTHRVELKCYVIKAYDLNSIN
jgi:hypothetical protein